MSYIHRTNGSSSALSNHSTTSVSTPSTVVHVGSRAAGSFQPEISTDPNPVPGRLASTGNVTVSGLTRGKDPFRPENRVLPTSNFLINRHKLLRKTEEGKVLHEGGTLTGTRGHVKAAPNLSVSGDLLAQPPETPPEKKNISTVVLNVAEKRAAAADERADNTSIDISDFRADTPTKQALVTSGGGDDPPSTRQLTSVRWSPTNTARPQVPPKPANFSVEPRIVPTNFEPERKEKSRGILRVPSLRGTLTRSRTPSQDRRSEDKSPKRKEEYLHESVVYTKTKPEFPLNGNRQHLLRSGKPQSNMTTTSRVEVSAPQFVNTTADQAQSATSIQIRGPRAPSPSPQRTEVIPTPVQVSGKGMIQVHVEREVAEPITTEISIAPVYARLSNARTSGAVTRPSRGETIVTRVPPLAAPSPAPSGFIKPQIRPTPPRKPMRSTEITESLLEVLPQKAKRLAPSPPAALQTRQPYRSEPVVSHTVRAATSSTVVNSSTGNLNNPPVRRVFSPERPVSHLKTTETLVKRGKSPDGSSYAGNMTFDDEFDSVMSSSHVDYEHSSADEADDLVKRSLVKASNRRAPIEDIQEENATATAYVEVAPSISSRSNLQPEYDRLPQRPLRQVITRKSSFLSSADDSDSSRGHPAPVRSSVITTTRLSRKEADNALAETEARQLAAAAAAARDDSAGRRKYDERRQLLRNFENGLQRRRIDSSKTSSSIESDTMDRDERSTQQRSNNVSKAALQTNYGYRRAGQRPVSSSRYADHESDDGASDSVGIPEPLPEYEYPSRVQGRTIEEVQEIRESVHLRNDSSSSTSSQTGDPSPSRGIGGPKRDHHFSRHFDISAEELNTARSLIHHRLPPSYGDTTQHPVMNQGAGSRLSLADQRSRTPPPSRPLMGGFARPGSESPDGRLVGGPPRGRLPPQGPQPPQQLIRGQPPPNVHHSDGETRYFSGEKKPKKKMGIVRRLSELVRGERKPKPDMTRKSSTSSMEQEQENRAPVLTSGVRNRRVSPIRRYQDQPLRPVVHNPAAPLNQNISRVPSFNRAIPHPRDNINRHSGNFSDTGTASFVYQDQLAPAAPQGPVYAQPNKLQKQQNVARYRSMSEYDLDRVGAHSQPPLHDLRYVNKPINPAKSVESITESVFKENANITARRYDHNPHVEKSYRVTKTTLVPWGKNKTTAYQPAHVRNTAYAGSSIYDKNTQHYSSTPVLNTMGQIDYRMAPPMKPPRRYDVTSRGSDSDPSTRNLDDTRSVSARHGQALERSRPESDLHLASHRHPSAQYSEPSESSRRPPTTSNSSGGEDTVPRTNRFQSSVYGGPRQAEQREEIVVRHQAAERQPAPTYARTRIAANDYANRRYQSAGAEMNRMPAAEAPARRLAPQRDPSEERRYKSSYKMLIDNPAPSRSVVQERSRFFSSNPPPRREVAVRR